MRVGRSLRWVVSVSAFSAACLWAATTLLGNPRDRIGEKLEDVTLRSLTGESVQLLSFQKDKVLVIAYTGLGCPISGRYAPRLEALNNELAAKGVSFVGINANPQDKPDAITAEMKELGITFPVLQDSEQLLTKQLDAQTTTIAFVVAKDGTIRYRGMIDDQYTLGAQKEKPTNKYLERAIRSVLAGKEPELAKTVAPGCLITRVQPDKAAEKVTYSSHIAKIIQDNCQSCHRPQQIAPFALTSYEAVQGWSAMIHSVVERDRMPPWNADDEFDGHFANERKLSETDKKMLLAWIEDGMPRGKPEEDPAPRKWPDQWRIGKPDKVYSMKDAFDVPAEGIVQYQYFFIPTDYRKDMWIQAMEIHAGAADVVHHVIAFTVDPNKRVDNSRLGLDDGFLCATVPGDTPSIFSPGQGKKLSAGHTLVLQVHYTTNGKKRKDKSQIGLIFAKDTPKQEVRTRGIYNLSFSIPPGDSNYEVRSSHTFTAETDILSYYPHMHFRGKSWDFIATYPDNTKKTLLSVPKYNYSWQESYILKEPLRIPAGTKIECIARFDNSSENFVNPDPTKTVKFGEQSWDEMMIGYVDYVVPVQN